VTGDILDRRSVRRALRDVARVFHVAGRTSLRLSAAEAYRVNVDGTRIVLDECMRAEVERVVHTSSVAAVGPAPRGSTADETQVFDAGGYGIPYVNAKHEAEVEALRMAARGLPVVIVNPGHVFGRGDVNRSSTEIVRRFLRRQIPAYTDGALNIIDVRDVVRGHLAADERGVVGERYILGNRNYTLDRLFADLGRVSGVEPPALKLPLPVAMAFAEAQVRLPGRPAATPVEVRASSLWWTYRNTKAKRELGWRPSPHEDAIEATVDWYREREGDKLARPGARQPVQLRAAGALAKSLGGLIGRVA
jgi:dihydroflavonol-4-reductase